MTPPPKRKKPFFSLSCGCRNSKSVSVSVSYPKPQDPKPDKPPDTLFSSETLTSTSSPSGDSSSSFSSLLRQLSDLEQSVLAWKCRTPTETQRRVGDSVAVVKDSDDPLTDFRRSMVEMIVEKEIVREEELKDLLWRFLALNATEHHDVIMRAFAEIWNEVFSGYKNTPEFLLNLRK